MEIEFWERPGSGACPIQKFLDDLNPQLKRKVVKKLEKILGEVSFEQLRQLGYIEKIKSHQNPHKVHEFRISVDKNEFRFFLVLYLQTYILLLPYHKKRRDLPPQVIINALNNAEEWHNSIST